MSNLRGHVKSGEYKGEPLFPHKHKDGMYVATTSRYEDDYIRVSTVEELETLVKSGYGARMSNPNINNAPSYIVNNNLTFATEAADVPESPLSYLPSIAEELDLDRNSITKQRKEQSFLRAHLINGRSIGNCVICQNDFPFDMLIAAHIKKRSACSTEEKKDFDNVAALMCKIDCDDLYEKGYISIVDGKVIKNKKRITTVILDTIISKIIGNNVNNWSGSKKYYEWHNKKI